MEIYNQTLTQSVKNPDLSKGYLAQQMITIHHEAVQSVAEQGHHEVVAEYPNGGKDLIWIVDVEGVEGHDAYDEQKEVTVYIPYTDAELRKINAEKRIEELKGFLFSSDYQAIKFAEGELSAEEYAQMKAQRQGWRAEINLLEANLKS